MRARRSQEPGRVPQAAAPEGTPVKGHSHGGGSADDDIDFGALTYLVVDDSRNARTLVKHALATYGGRNFLEAGDAADALKILYAEKVDVVLLDNEMVPMTGVELTRLIRRDPEPSVAESIIIMISGFSEERRVVEARNAGVHEFLVKPVSAKAVGERIRSVLRNPRPFERSPDYIGPERRWEDLPPGLRAAPPEAGADAASASGG